MKALWNDESGAVTTIELLIYGTIAGLGIVAGVANLRNAVVIEFTELANAILHLSQGYSVGGVTSPCATSDGSAAVDLYVGSNVQVCTPAEACFVGAVTGVSGE